MIPIRARPKFGPVPDQADPESVAITPLDLNDFLNAGTPPFEWLDIDQTLPTGLFLDKDTGIISLSPSAPSVFAVTVSVRNATGLSRSSWTWTIT